MQIVTDSAADLTPEELEAWDIKVIPLFIGFPDKEVSAADITPDEFYNRLVAMSPQIPKTSQPSLGILLEAYNKILATGEKVFSVHVSSGLSNTAKTAQSAANEINETTAENVTVVDSMTLSCEQRFQVLAAAMANKAGWPAQKIVERLALIQKNSVAGFTLGTLDYLARGGRIGRVQALAGSILKIKPVIKVDKTDGKYTTIGKGRTFQQSLTTLLEHFVATHGASKPVWVTVVHGQLEEKAEAFANMLRERLNVVKLDILRISPVLGVHTGPEIVGGGIVPMELFQDLES